jgi:autotransporter-associated beta strand protein
LTITSGNIADAVVEASSKYSLTDVADYAADLTGATATLVIGEARASDASVKLSGTGNTYGGNTTINRGAAAPWRRAPASAR